MIRVRARAARSTLGAERRPNQPVPLVHEDDPRHVSGGLMIHFSVIATFYKMGVGIGPLVAYLTAWSLFGLQRIIMWEIPFLGPKVVAIRFAVSFFFPLFAGWLCEQVWNRLHV